MQHSVADFKISSLFETIALNQGIETCIDRLSSSCNFCNFIKGSHILAHLKDFYQFTKPFKEFYALHCTCFYKLDFKQAYDNLKIVKSINQLKQNV